MKQALQLKLGQSLSMTPQMQQAIRMLQLGTLELRAEVMQALETNPFLELEEAPSTSEAPVTEDLDVHHAEYEQRMFEAAQWQVSASSNKSYDNSDWPEAQVAQSQSLQEQLSWQIEMSRLSARDQMLAMTLIDSIDDRGFLITTLPDLLRVAEQTRLHMQNTDIDILGKVELDELEVVLVQIQHLDPLGVGARSLSECLLLQLNGHAQRDQTQQDAVLLLEQHTDALCRQNLQLLIKQAKLSESRIVAALELIRSLEVAPGERIAPTPVDYVIPDVYAYKLHGQWQVSLNPETTPQLKLNRLHESQHASLRSPEAKDYVKAHLQDAKWLIKSLHSRHDTLLKIATDIVRCQNDFFEQGELAMKPMILADVANRVEMHESTVSRVTTQKFIHTPRGVFELKYFFSSNVRGDYGEDCSSTAIRARIKQIIAEEDQAKPLSDNKISSLLAAEGIQVARRTIAKYRELDHILPSSQRRNTL